MSVLEIDYRKYYAVEEFLFGEVSEKFRTSGKIDPLDFYFIVIWKANRAKSKIREKLKKLAGDFSGAVREISKGLRKCQNAEQRLDLLMRKWKFRLPMATAILTVLYPSEFTVYDVRVCEQLGDFKKLGNWQFSKKLWGEYLRFVTSVKAAAPAALSLREKDRYLWGKSAYSQAFGELGI